MITINLTNDDIVSLRVIEMDKDYQGAYDFIKDRILPEIKKMQGIKMTSHLDGGKGSIL